MEGAFQQAGFAPLTKFSRSKICSRCKIKKSYDNFYADQRRKDVKRLLCIDCQQISNCNKIKCDSGKEISYAKMSRHRKTVQHKHVMSIIEKNVNKSSQTPDPPLNMLCIC
jgi:hypothetical protein